MDKNQNVLTNQDDRVVEEKRAFEWYTIHILCKTWREKRLV